MLLDALEQALRLEVRDDALARDEPVEPAIRGGAFSFSCALSSSTPIIGKLCRRPTS